MDKERLHKLFRLEIHHLKLLGQDSSPGFRVHTLTHLWLMDYLHEVATYFEGGKRVLEVGCGGGYFANLLKQAGYDVIAGDITGPRTPLGQFWKLQRSKLDLTPDFIRFDARAIPFRDNTFDGVIAIAVLEHIEQNEEKSLQEISRVLCPEAAFFIYELPRKPSYEYLLRALGFDTRHEKFYTRASISKLLNQSGFKVVAVDQYWYAPRSLIKLVKASIFYLLAKRLKALNPLSSFLKVICVKKF